MGRQLKVRNFPECSWEKAAFGATDIFGLSVSVKSAPFSAPLGSAKISRSDLLKGPWCVAGLVEAKFGTCSLDRSAVSFINQWIGLGEYFQRFQVDQSYIPAIDFDAVRFERAECPRQVFRCHT